VLLLLHRASGLPPTRAAERAWAVEEAHLVLVLLLLLLLLLAEVHGELLLLLLLLAGVVPSVLAGVIIALHRR